MEVALGRKWPSKLSWGFRGLCRAVMACKEGFQKVIRKGNSDLLHERWLSVKELTVKDPVFFADFRDSKGDGFVYGAV